MDVPLPLHLVIWTKPIQELKKGLKAAFRLISVCSWWLFQGEHTISGHDCCWEVAILESELKYVKSIVHQHTSLTVFSLLLPSSSKTRKSVCQIKQKSLWKLQTKTFSHFWGFLSRRPQFKFIRASTTLYYRTGWENVTNLYFFRYFPSLSKPLTHTVRSLSVQSAECVCADIREEERRHHAGLLCHPHTSINITAFILRGVCEHMCACVCVTWNTEGTTKQNPITSTFGITGKTPLSNPCVNKRCWCGSVTQKKCLLAANLDVPRYGVSEMCLSLPTHHFWQWKGVNHTPNNAVFNV